MTATGIAIGIAIGATWMALSGTAVAAGAVVIAPLHDVAQPPDTAPVETVPADTAPVDTEPIDTTPVDTAPADTEPTDNEPSDTVPDGDAPGADEQPNADLIAERQEDLSAWWWIGAGLATGAAILGVGYAFRRRRIVETWARDASLACDAGRAMIATLVEHLDADDSWSVPERYPRQRQRFTAALHALEAAIPRAQFEAPLAAATQHDEMLRAVVDSLVDRRPMDGARTVVLPAIEALSAALSDLERNASITVFGAALPSSRPSG